MKDPVNDRRNEMIEWSNRMDKETKNLYQNILKNKQLEESLPGFLGSLADKYHTQAAVRLALHYYSFYESYCDEGEHWNEAIGKLLDQLNQVIGKNIVSSQSGLEHEEAIRTVDKLRSEIIRRMKLLTSYLDVCSIREYILNRIEYRFKETDSLEEDEEFAREILQFIFDSQDNVVINDRIKEVIGQLPIRMTKLKFFDLIRGSIREYIGASQDTLESYLYILRSSALLEVKKEPDPIYPGLQELKKTLFGQDYKNITAEEYEKADQELKEAAAFLEAEIDIYYILQEIVNEVYTLLLCEPYAGMSVSTHEQAGKAALEVVRELNSLFGNGLKQEPPADLLKHFEALEGIQEEMSYDLTVLEEALYQVDLSHRKLAESIMVDKLLNILLLSMDLLSNSLFIDFYEIRSKLIISEVKAGEEAELLIGELTKLLGNCDRMVSRAIMANVLNKVPVFFGSHKEVMDYVLNSLEQCTDLAEKAACFEIIRDMMCI